MQTNERRAGFLRVPYNIIYITPKQFVDKVAGEIKDICDSLNTSYDKFIRTTDDYHEKQVQKIFRKLYEQGDIYKGAENGFEIKPDNEGKNTGISYNKIITQVQTTVKENLLPMFRRKE